MSTSKAQPDLELQLNAYAAAKPENCSYHLHRWPIYAAATGAALAMATAADAGIIMSGTSGSSVAVPVPGSGSSHQFSPLIFRLPIRSGTIPNTVGLLGVNVGRSLYNTWGRIAMVGMMSFDRTAVGPTSASSAGLQRFNRGSSISGAQPFAHGWASVRGADAGTSSGSSGWKGTANGGTGFAGFRIPRSTTSGSPAYAYGWIY